MRTPQRDGHVPTVPSASPEANVKRRRFLLALGAGGAASAAAAAQAIGAPVAQENTAAERTESRGYRETDHVRHYYASTRI
jgi:shikimate 5-dehydrogenase